MKKQDAISIFGKKAVDLARGVNRCRSSISQWPENLTDDHINMVLGAAVRKGLHIPEQFLAKK